MLHLSKHELSPIVWREWRNQPGNYVAVCSETRLRQPEPVHSISITQVIPLRRRFPSAGPLLST